MKNAEKYRRNYFLPPKTEGRWLQKDYIETPPIWCSVDLRDGNQALVTPMGVKEKLEFFEMLVKLGFKEIEVGFPAASETEFSFVRKLIEEDRIPDDVTIQVITQARDHIIKKTFDSLRGAKKAIVHIYHPTSKPQREQVFQKSREEVKALALSAMDTAEECIRSLPKTDITLQYCAESFTGTEMDFALEICNAVIDKIAPTREKKMYIDLPATVSCSLSHVYANQIEYMSDHLHRRDSIVLTIHPHNDRGSAVADAELALLAGAERVEGTLFGNGERTGNVDLMILALNMYAHGVDPKLDFSHLPELCALYERVTGMRVPPRYPYGGRLVFSAFSGGHQDAIAKSMDWRETHPDAYWDVPYLPLDPADIGRNPKEDIIRINSQSGKGGIGYLMAHRYGYFIPPKFREEFGYYIKDLSDKSKKELLPEDIFSAFQHEYVNLSSPMELLDCTFSGKDEVTVSLSLRINEEFTVVHGKGNGSLNAVSNTLKASLGLTFSNMIYNEHALEEGSHARALAYVGVTGKDQKLYWGAGIHTDITTASVQALISACNRMIQNA